MQQHAAIHIVSADDVFSTATSAALGVDESRLTRLTSWREPVGEAPRLIIFDGGLTSAEEFAVAERLVRSGGTKALCMLPDDGSAIGILTHHPFLDCVVSRSGGLLPGDLVPVVANLLAERAAGVEAYLAPATPVQGETLTSYAEKDACLERLLAFVGSLPSFVDFPQIAVSVVWEMLMNALIDAPSQGQEAKDGKARGVELRYGSDRRRLAVSVQDQYGSLTRAKVVENLARSHRQGPDQIRSGKGGAGVGLYLMFSHASQLHFSVRPGVATKVVLVMRVSKRYGEFTEGGRAFNFMIEGDT